MQPAHCAAYGDHCECLRVLSELGVDDSLSKTDLNDVTPAQLASESGHTMCVKVLEELGHVIVRHDI